MLRVKGLLNAALLFQNDSHCSLPVRLKFLSLNYYVKNRALRVNNFQICLGQHS